jgi:hypothetical protein
MAQAHYIAIYPGIRFTNASVVSLSGDKVSARWSGTVCTDYTERGSPDIAALRRFTSALEAAASGLTLTAVLVRSPPPARVVREAEHLQANTLAEGFLIGWAHAAFPHTPTWYQHPNAVKAYFLTPEAGQLDRDDFDDQLMASALDVLPPGTSLRSAKEAHCVLMSLLHYEKFVLPGQAGVESTTK